MSSYPNYTSQHGGSLRPSPTGGHSHRGSYSEQGRATTLPPPAFSTTDSPGLSSNVNPTYLSSTFASLTTGPTNYPYPTQQRSTPIPIDQHIVRDLGRWCSERWDSETRGRGWRRFGLEPTCCDGTVARINTGSVVCNDQIREVKGEAVRGC
jgi:hypothetical protein